MRIIHRDDRFRPAIPTQDFPHLGKRPPAGPVDRDRASQTRWRTHSAEGNYLYRYQPSVDAPHGSRQLLTLWFTDPFARATDIGELSAVAGAIPFQLDGRRLQNPELDDLAYELQVEEFNEQLSMGPWSGFIISRAWA